MANNNWRIQLEAILNQASVANIQKELDKHKVKIGVEVQGKEASLKSINTLANAMASFRDNNTKMTKDMKTRLNDMYDTLKNGANLSQAEVSELRTRFSQLKLEVRGLSRLGGGRQRPFKRFIRRDESWISRTQKRTGQAS